MVRPRYALILISAIVIFFLILSKAIPDRFWAVQVKTAKDVKGMQSILATIGFDNLRKAIFPPAPPVSLFSLCVGPFTDKAKAETFISENNLDRKVQLREFNSPSIFYYHLPFEVAKVLAQTKISPELILMIPFLIVLWIADSIFRSYRRRRKKRIQERTWIAWK